MQSAVDVISTFAVLGGGTLLIVLGIVVARPHIHGANFTPGQCRINAAVNNMTDQPTCDCREECGEEKCRECEEEYPCINVYATFYSNVTNPANTTSPSTTVKATNTTPSRNTVSPTNTTPSSNTINSTNTTIWNGVVYANYNALKAHCLYKPSCSPRYTKNAQRVYNYFAQHIAPLVSDYTYPHFSNITHINYPPEVSIFPCWGKDGAIYISHGYALWKAYLVLILPSLLILVGLIMMATVASREYQELLFALLTAPFVAACSLCYDLCCSCCCEKAQCSAEQALGSAAEFSERRSAEEESAILPPSYNEALKTDKVDIRDWDNVDTIFN